jgi:hypothetical protein
MIVNKKLHKLLLYLQFKYFDKYQNDTYQKTINNKSHIITKDIFNDKLKVKIYEDLNYWIKVHDIFFENENELYEFLNKNYKKQIRKFKLNDW